METREHSEAVGIGLLSSHTGHGRQPTRKLWLLTLSLRFECLTLIVEFHALGGVNDLLAEWCNCNLHSTQQCHE